MGFSDKAVNVNALSVTATVRWLFYAFSSLATALPFLLAYQTSPQPAFYSQAISCSLWALTLLVYVVIRRKNIASVPMATRVWLGFWMLLVAIVLLHGLTGRAPIFVVAPALLNLGLAAALTWAMLSEPSAVLRRDWLRSVLLGLLIGALYNALVVLWQHTFPEWRGNAWIAVASGRNFWGPGSARASGNLYQPNLLASLLLFGMVVLLLRCADALRQGLVRTVLPALGLLGLLLALIATGSRTGLVGLMVVVALLGMQLVGRWQRLPTWALPVRAALVVTLLLWVALSLWQHAENPFTRSGADASLQQRFLLWNNTVQLIKAQPWWGVGFGQFNQAWSLMPLHQRAPDVFDNAHNLPLHWAAELGLPFAVVLLALLVWAGHGVMRHRHRWLDDSVYLAAALILLGLLLHSLTEYPLWFSYFLLPAALLSAALLRAAMGPIDADAQEHVSLRTQRVAPTLVGLVAAAALGATIYGVHEYRKLAAIHSASDVRTRAVAVRRAQASWLYGHYGDYAAIILSPSSAPLAWFERPLRNVVDERLLQAWSTALRREGRSEEAEAAEMRGRELVAHETPTRTASTPRP